MKTRKSRKDKLSEETEKQIIDYYINKKFNSVQIGKIFNVSATCVAKVLRRNGYKLRSKQIAMKKYNLNRNYFEKVDSHEKAALIGFIAADGCIIYNNKTRGGKTMKLAFGVHPKDENYIQYLKTKIEYTGPVNIRMAKYGRNNKEYLPTCRLEISDSKLCSDLINKGIGMRKSFNMDFPNNDQIPLGYINSYMKGIFEGDGWLTVNKVLRKDNSCYLAGALGISVTKRFGNKLQKLLKETLNINSRMVFKYKGNPDHIYNFHIGGNQQILKFCEWIYKDSSFIMQRKYDKYLVLLCQNNFLLSLPNKFNYSKPTCEF